MSRSFIFFTGTRQKNDQIFRSRHGGYFLSTAGCVALQDQSRNQVHQMLVVEKRVATPPNFDIAFYCPEIRQVVAGTSQHSIFQARIPAYVENSNGTI